uniref:BAH domain-containing protein n=1 Tax=Meloidogyne javanica TaxID=6303 RepID=A0A915LC18_MELJA
MTSGGKAPVTSTPEQQQKTNDGNTKSPKTNENNEEENISENATILTTKTEETGKEEEKEEESEESELKQNENPQQKQKNHLRPDEYNDGLWDAEPFYYCTNGPTTARGYVPSDEQSGAGKRQKRGLIYKKRENVSGGAANEYECFQSHEGIVYRHGDHVFVESCREDPFLVGSIVSFKMKKRDQLLVKLLRYYRPNDVPELSFSLVTQARIEGKNNKYFQFIYDKVCKLE